MDTKEKLELALKDAMKSGDDVTKRTVRMAMAAIRQIEIDKQTKLDEPAVLSVIQREIKTRRDDIEEARRANRLDLIADTEAEINVLQAYLPQALTPEELNALVREAIAEAGATSPADMGKVMKLLMPKVGARAPGNQVSAAVRDQLQKG
jgi:uncharacterized protein YqeY